MTDVLFEKRPDGVAVITMNRPESLNAMGGELIPLLGRYLAECERDREVRCVALTGNGRGFCAGGDVKGMQTRNDQAQGGATAARPRSFVPGLESAVRELRASHDATVLKMHTMAKPTVALVNGVAVGAGTVGVGVAVGFVPPPIKPVYSKRLAEPVPGPDTLLVDALPVSAVITALGLALGLAAR